MENSLNGESLVEKISPYGQRTVNQYRTWLKQMKDGAANVEFDWINKVVERRKRNLSFVKADDIISTLDSIADMYDEDIALPAIVTDVNIRRNTRLNYEQMNMGLLKEKED